MRGFKKDDHKPTLTLGVRNRRKWHCCSNWCRLLLSPSSPLVLDHNKALCVQVPYTFLFHKCTLLFPFLFPLADLLGMSLLSQNAQLRFPSCDLYEGRGGLFHFKHNGGAFGMAAETTGYRDRKLPANRVSVCTKCVFGKHLKAFIPFVIAGMKVASLGWFTLWLEKKIIFLASKYSSCWL